jgi:hypothetical protein
MFSKVYKIGELPEIDEIIDRIRRKYEPPGEPGRG